MKPIKVNNINFGHYIIEMSNTSQIKIPRAHRLSVVTAFIVTVICAAHCGGATQDITSNGTVCETEAVSSKVSHVKTEPHLGMIFPSIEMFIDSVLSSMKDDPNLHIRPDDSREEFVWLRDDAPDQHPWLYLFKKLSDNAFRFVLFIPGAQDVSFLTDQMFPDVYMDDRQPGYPHPSAIFKFLPALQYYVPVQCKEKYSDRQIRHEPPSKQTDGVIPKNMRNIDCREVFLNYGDMINGSE